MRKLLERDAGGVEVPVVVEVMRARPGRAPRGTKFGLVAVAAAQVDSGAGHEELLENGVLFDVVEWDFVIEAQFDDGFAESVGDVEAFLRFDSV